MIADYFRISFSSFKRRKLRTALTLLGIFIGIALLVTLMSLGSGLQNFVQGQFERMGSDKLMISPGTSILGSAAEGLSLGKTDKEVVERTLGVEIVTGMVFKMSPVTFREEMKYTFVIGMDTDKASVDLFKAMMGSWKLEKGRELTQNDKSKVTIGIDVATDKKMFKKGASIGDKINIEGKEFTIVGIYGRIGNPEDDAQIYMEMDTARELFNEPDKYDFLIAKVASGDDPASVVGRIKKDLRKSRNVKEKEEDFIVQTPEQMLESFGTVLTVIEAVLIGLATISLLVGGIGIANTMYTSILERTREIGVMKAIGARNSDIATFFIIESGLIGLGAGIIGVTIGWLISKGIEAAIHFAGYTMLNVYMPAWLLLGGMAFAFVFGILSGLIPALKAARLKPVDALRYE